MYSLNVFSLSSAKRAYTCNTLSDLATLPSDVEIYTYFVSSDQLLEQSGGSHHTTILDRYTHDDLAYEKIIR